MVHKPNHYMWRNRGASATRYRGVRRSASLFRAVSVSTRDGAASAPQDRGGGVRQRRELSEVDRDEAPPQGDGIGNGREIRACDRPDGERLRVAAPRPAGRDRLPCGAPQASAGRGQRQWSVNRRPCSEYGTPLPRRGVHAFPEPPREAAAVEQGQEELEVLQSSRTADTARKLSNLRTLSSMYLATRLQQTLGP